MTIHLYSIFFTFFIFININSSYNQQTAQKIYFCGGLAAGLSHQVHTQKKIPGFLSQKNSGFIIKVIKEIEKQKLYEKLLYSALTAYDVKENYFSLTGKKFEYYLKAYF